jgi:hypothetical protein
MVDNPNIWLRDRGTMTEQHLYKDDHLLKNFYVISVISNPVRYHSRYAHYKNFEKHMQESGVKLITVETTFGDRHHKVTQDDPNHIKLKTWDEIWHKENMINIAASRLPSDWEYVAWIDADVTFLRKDWALETVHQLQHYMIVQMFETAIDTGPTGAVFNTYRGFAWSHVTGQPYPKANKYYPYWHPGFAWACRREAFDHLGGLIDFAILGAADHHMALSLIGKGQDSFPPGANKNYIKMVLDWQDRASHLIKHDIGFVPGSLMHHWHGKKKDRKYWDRWQILTKNDFDPMVDIHKDSQGLYQLTTKKPLLRDQLRAYFRQRNEDSIDFE